MSDNCARSRYDDLHDRYHEILTTKRGTRYEILAAVVFAALERDAVVIQDLEVVGRDTGVEHQIDIQVEKNGGLRRVLIECKDYDVRGAPVGLGVVRNFQGVLDDVHPDEAWIVTCNGFTAPAMQYAKGKGIRLATLRVFEQADWQNRVHTFVVFVQHIVLDPERTDVRINMADEDAAIVAAQLAKFRSGIAFDNDPTQIYDGESIRSMGTIIHGLAKIPLVDGDTEAAEGKMTPGGWVTVDGIRRFPMNGFRIAVPVRRFAQEIRVQGDQGAARLLLSEADGLDFVVWEDTLQGYTIENDGTVRLAQSEKQNALRTIVTVVDAVRSQQDDADESKGGSR